MGASPIRRFRRRQKLPTLDSVRPGNKWSPVEAMGPAARSCATPGDGLERRLSPAHRRPAWERRRRQDVNSRERSDRAAAAGAAGVGVEAEEGADDRGGHGRSDIGDAHRGTDKCGTLR